MTAAHQSPDSAKKYAGGFDVLVKQMTSWPPTGDGGGSRCVNNSLKLKTFPRNLKIGWVASGVQNPAPGGATSMDEHQFANCVPGAFACQHALALCSASESIAS